MNILSFIIEAKDKFSATMAKANADVTKMGLTWKGAFDGAKAGNFSGLLAMVTKFAPVMGAAAAAMKGLGAAWDFVSSGLAQNTALEKMAVRLSVITGSVKSARAEIEQLTKGKYAVDDLFSEEDIVNGVIALKRLSGGVLGTAGDMEKLAGVAYATGQSLSEISQSVGMLTGMILGGEESWGRYAKQLIASGAVSKDVITQMERMQAEGKGAGDMVAYLWANLNGQSSSTLDEARKALEGLTSAADDAADDAKKAWAGNVESAAKAYQTIRAGWYGVVEWFGKNPARLQMLNIFSPVGAMARGGWEATKGFFGKGDAAGPTGGDATSAADIALKGNAKGKEQAAEKAASAQAEKDKEVAKKSVETTNDLLKKKEEAQKKFDVAQRSRGETLSALEKERADLVYANLSPRGDGTDARIAAETRLLEIDTELLKIRKDITDEAVKASAEESAARRESQNTESKAKGERLVAQSQDRYHRAYDAITPEQQLSRTNKNISTWEKNVAKAKTEEEKKIATDGLIAQLQERDRLQKEAVAKDKDRAKETESLALRDREMRESKMSPEQKMAESKKRQRDLEKDLDKETDPDKKLALKSKLMDEAEKQVALEVEKPGRRSMSIGDVFEKGYGQGGKKDPAKEQVELSKDIKRLLEKIEKKPGGMGL